MQTPEPEPASAMLHSIAAPTLAMVGAGATRERGPKGTAMDTVVLPAGTILWACTAHVHSGALQGNMMLGTLPAIAKSCGAVSELRDVVAYRLTRDVKLLNLNSDKTEDTQLACAVEAVAPLPREVQLGLASALSAVGEHAGSPMIMAIVFPMAAACQAAAVYDHDTPLAALAAPTEEAYDRGISSVLHKADALVTDAVCLRPAAYGADGWFRREALEDRHGASFLDEVLLCRGAVAGVLQEVDMEELTEAEEAAVLARIRELGTALKAADPSATTLVRNGAAVPGTAGGKDPAVPMDAKQACRCPCHRHPGSIKHVRPCC